uniref:SSD domain-containing protein n=1 Tax=Setaria digitata TaxID=48799 RepID=A0A915PJ47_9BILA
MKLISLISILVIYNNCNWLLFYPFSCLDRPKIERLETIVQSFEIPDVENTIKFKEFYIPGGNLNYFLEAFKLGYDLKLLHNGSDDSIVLTYPHSQIFGQDIAISSHFFGVKLIDNYVEKKLPTEIESASVISLFYMLQAHGFKQKYRLRQWQLGLHELSLKENYSDLFIFYVYSDQVANAEMERANLRSLKLFGIGAMFMVIYIMNTSRMFTFKSQILLVLTAITSPLLATTVSFGIMEWFNFSITSMMGLIPLLMLGIGVDDAFLLIHSWKRHISVLDVPERLGKTFAAVGPSITITSITNMLAFGISSTTAPPMLSSFCLCMFIAVGMDYILELTIFAPTLAIAAHLDNDNVIIKKESLRDLSQSWTLLAQIITSKIGVVIIIVFQIIFYIISTIGVVNMEANFDPSKTFSSDSKLIKCVEIADRIYSEYAPVTFIVNNPPNISNSTELAHFMQIIEEIENLPMSRGKNFTLIWMNDYFDVII